MIAAARSFIRTDCFDRSLNIALHLPRFDSEMLNDLPEFRALIAGAKKNT